MRSVDDTRWPLGPGVAADTAARVANADQVVLVEGVSDRAAVEALAPRLGRDLEAERVVVVPVGGAGGMAAHLRLLVDRHPSVRRTGLVDEAESPVVARALEAVGLGHDLDRRGLARLGFEVCQEDLEAELIAALGPPQVELLLEREGDLRSFRTLQRQPEWRGRPVAAQLRRYFGAGARRKVRYARIMAEAVDLDRAPAALVSVLSAPASGS